MVKTIIQEIIIFLLLLISIALLLGIVLYEYIPTTREIPPKVVPYKLPEDVKEELESSLSLQEGGKIETTYYIDSNDLKEYEVNHQYDKGKINPFEKYVPPQPQSPTSPEEPGNTNPSPNPNPDPNANTNTNNNTANNSTGGNNNTNDVGNFYNPK